MQEIVYVVSENDKQRFQHEWLDADADFNQDGPWGQQLYVRAVQGHSLTRIDPSLVLTELDLSRIAEIVPAHGTYYDYYKSIIQHGLLAGGPSRSRTHIHLTEWLPSGRPLSGMRDTTDIVLWLNIRQAAAAGIKFYVSKNRVILTEGPDGILPMQYLKSVQVFKSGEYLPAVAGPPDPNAVMDALLRSQNTVSGPLRLPDQTWPAPVCNILEMQRVPSCLPSKHARSKHRCRDLWKQQGGEPQSGIHAPYLPSLHTASAPGQQARQSQAHSTQTPTTEAAHGISLALVDTVW